MKSTANKENVETIVVEVGTPKIHTVDLDSCSESELSLSANQNEGQRESAPLLLPPKKRMKSNTLLDLPSHRLQHLEMAKGDETVYDMASCITSPV